MLYRSLHLMTRHGYDHNKQYHTYFQVPSWQEIADGCHNMTDCHELTESDAVQP